MILTDWMESEINYVTSSNDKHEVFRSGNTGRERGDGSSRVGRNWRTWSKLAGSTGVQHCVRGFLISPDISLWVPKRLPGPNPESQELPWEKAMAVSVTGGLSTNKRLRVLPVLITTALGSSKPEQGTGVRRGRGDSQKLEQVSSAG